MEINRLLHLYIGVEGLTWNILIKKFYMKNLITMNRSTVIVLSCVLAIIASFLTLKAAYLLGAAYRLPAAGVRLYVHNQADLNIDSIFIKTQYLDYQSSMKVAPQQTTFIFVPQQSEGSFLLSIKTSKGELLTTHYTYVEAGYVVHDTLFNNTISNRIK